jgi:predicted RNase H-like HicB family nuclease
MGIMSGNMNHIKIIIEQHPDGYIAYPVGLQGIVIGQGETYQDALEDVKSAIAFHLETFGAGVFQDYDLIAAKIAEVTI